MKQTLLLLALALSAAVSPSAIASGESSADDLCPLPTMTRENYPSPCLASYDSSIFAMLRTAVSQQRDCYFDAKGNLRSQAEADRCLAMITTAVCGPQVMASLRALEICHASPTRSGS